MKYFLALALIISADPVFAQSKLYGRSRQGSASAESGSSSSSMDNSRFYIGLVYTSQLRTKYPTTTDTALPFTYETDVSYQDGAGLELGYSYFPARSFGFTAGVAYGLEKEVSKISMAGVSLNPNGNKIQITEIILGSQYRDDRLYIPFGLLYSMVKFIPYSSFTGTHEEKGGLGYQAGIGFLLGQMFSMEILYRTTPTSLRSSVPGNTQDFGTGTLSTLNVVGKVYF